MTQNRIKFNSFNKNPSIFQGSIPKEMKVTFTDGTDKIINFIRCIVDLHKNVTCPSVVEFSCPNLLNENVYMKNLLAG